MRAIEKGVVEILKFTGKYSIANKNAIMSMDPLPISFLPFKDVRPASRWIYKVTIHNTTILDLPDVDTTSYEEDEYTPLEKAQVLIDPEKTNIAYRRTFLVETLQDYLVSVQEILSDYYADMAKDGVNTLTIKSQTSAAITDELDMITSRIYVQDRDWETR